jgi:hypothetical protein
MTKTDIPAAAEFVGLERADLRRNQVTIYRRDFSRGADAGGEPTWLHLFADSRYRLWVNGEFVAAGPARFVTGHPEYDSVDLGPWLRAGANCVVVEVHAYGCSSYQTMPDGRDGFIAWGCCGETDLRTPGEWRARRAEAWAETASLLTFAQNACEICDTRRLDEAWYRPGEILAAEGWAPARVLSAEERVWGRLTERSVPMPKLGRAWPARVAVAGALEGKEEVFGFHFPEIYEGSAQELPKGLQQVFQAWIWSPVEQESALALHWGAYWLNGAALDCAGWPGRGQRTEKTVRLRAGWNRLSGHLEFLTQSEFWDAVFGLPAGAGLRVAARPADGVAAKFLLAGERVPKERLGEWLGADGTPVEREGWRENAGEAAALTPARVMAWQNVDESTVRRDRPYAEVAGELGLAARRGSVWVLDFGREVLGHLELEIEGPAGRVVDVGYDEWQQPNGLIDLYRTNPYVNTVERYVLRGGRQVITGLNPRGGRFVQVVVYPETGDDTGAARLLGLAVRETKTLSPGEAAFAAGGDAELAAIWRAGVDTLIGSTEDAYSDSPWRERGTYIGDFTVNQQVQRLVTADLRVARRALRVFAQAQLENGQLPMVAPAFHRKAHEDFSLIWVLGVWEHWAMTGDETVVAEVWPAIERLWKSPAWRPGADGLWAGEGLALFIDWGVVMAERGGQANGVLNAFRILALEKAAALAGVLGKTDRSRELAAEAGRVREAFARVFWREEAGCYAAYVDANGRKAESTAAHANVLAWVLRIGTEERQARVEAWLWRFLAGNFELGNAGGQWAGHIELYFFRFLLAEMAERGLGKRALGLVRRHWGPLVADRFGTLPECFCRFEKSVGSRCHSWSAHASVWLTQWVLGLRQETPGDADRWVLAPALIEGIERAEGVIPHARGLIRVRWERGKDGRLETSVEAPDGVKVACRAG